MHIVLLIILVALALMYLIGCLTVYKQAKVSVSHVELRLIHIHGACVLLALAWPLIMILFIADVTINRKNYKLAQYAKGIINYNPGKGNTADNKTMQN